MTRLRFALTIAAVLAGAAPVAAQQQPAPAPADQGNGNWDPPAGHQANYAALTAKRASGLRNGGGVAPSERRSARFVSVSDAGLSAERQKRIGPWR
jgi:hypothetical protein